MWKQISYSQARTIYAHYKISVENEMHNAMEMHFESARYGLNTNHNVDNMRLMILQVFIIMEGNEKKTPTPCALIEATPWNLLDKHDTIANLGNVRC